MKLFFTGLFLLSIISFAKAEEDQKLEGRCSGSLTDDSQVKFSYFSNYEGCQGSIDSSIKFSPESGLEDHKGKRTFENHKDIYSFKVKQEVYRLTFEDSTGNTSGVFDYFDLQGYRQSIIVQCEINDFEYDDCASAI